VKASELRALSEDQLEERLGELHDEWRNLRFQEAIGKLTATARTREIRKTIARIHTIRTERETEAATRAYLAAAGRTNQ
jgi:large subunit ribosomal protein L29